MTVKEIFKLIHLNDNVSIIDKKDVLNNRSGDGKNIPLRYFDCIINNMYSSPTIAKGSFIVINFKKNYTRG